MTGDRAELAIRPGELAELDAIQALECASFAQDRISRRALARMLKAPHRPLLAAREGGRIVGFVALSLAPNGRWVRVYSLAVEAGSRGRGVGRELLLAAERYARAQGRRALRLEVRYDNVPALALYEKLGFEAFGRYPAYYSDGAAALRFEKALE